MDDNDPIMQTRLDVAEMKGMLTQLVASHNERLNGHDRIINLHEARLNDKGKLLARHDERISDLEDDNSSRWGRVTGTIGLVVSGLVAVLAVFNSLRIGGI